MPEKAYRPLTKGMFCDRSALNIEDGGFKSIKEYNVTPNGLHRRPGWATAFTDDDYRTVTDTAQGHAVGLDSFWYEDGTQDTLLFTDDALYVADWKTGFYWAPYITVDTGTWTSADGLTWTLSGGPALTSATDLDLVEAGDYLDLSTFSTPRLIESVDSSTQVTIEAGESLGSGLSGEVWSTFRNYIDRDMPDWVRVFDTLAMVGKNQNGITQLGGSTGAREIEDYVTTLYTKRFRANACGFYNERLWIGDMTEWNSVSSAHEEYRQRLRYSDALAPETFDDTSYVDLTYSGGNCKRIIPLGNLLAVYFEDAVYLGQPTNDPDLPVVFDNVESGGVGLIGKRAITRYLDGHFFVGQDNIYYHSTRGLQKIGTPVLCETIRQCTAPWRINVANDPIRDRIVFAFPKSNISALSEIWSFNYLTSAWSYEVYGTGEDLWMVDVAYVNRGVTWADLTMDWDEIDAIYPTGGSLDQEDETNDLFCATDTRLRAATEDKVDDAPIATGSDIVIQPVMESKDEDLGAPDIKKRFTRLAIKLDIDSGGALTSDLEFDVDISHNRGRTWRRIPRQLVVREGMDEGFLDFRMHTPHLRFKLSGGESEVAYSVTDYTMRYYGGGREGDLRSQE